jgi:C1A family cysteine protease
MSFRSAVLSALAAVALAGNLHDRSFYQSKFYNWLAQYKVDIANGEQFVHMLQNFANNEDIINTHNAQPNVSYTLGHNQYSHLSLDEWRQHVQLGLKKPEETEAPLYTLEAAADMSTLAAAVDWVAQGAVTGVKDQGQCGSCWSFSATGAMEGRYKIKKGVLTSLSEQDFVDCDNRSNGGSDLGCNGGLMDSAFSWAKKNGGICTEAAYPYVSGTTKKSGTCTDSKCTKQSAPLGYVDVQKNSDSALVTALNAGPVSVAIEADQSSFQLYKSGVFTGTCGTNLDHGVLAVGYGTDGAYDYYKVKNSWGTSWGEKGYIRIQKGKAQTGGQCGILMGPPSYPTY